jgi:hypothetical protein
MPTVQEKITKVLYTPVEIELSPKLEEIIFKINIQPNGEFSTGAKFKDIIKGLNAAGLHYSDALVLNVLKKLQKDFILQEIDEKWYSCLI